MRNILITGAPGVGKTTLMKKIIEHMKMLKVDCDGFYTEEIRHNNNRTGFDIITLDGKRAVLARKTPNQQYPIMPSVGAYSVYVDDFEKLALPIFEQPKELLVIDEIGKMELFSKKFQDSIRKVTNDRNIRIIATVPLKTGLALVKQLKEDPNCHLIMVNHGNRDDLAANIAELLNKI